MNSSKSFDQFLISIASAEELLNIERSHYSNPPKSEHIKAVCGLRGGAAVLMVAAFENFLRQVFEECLIELSLPHVNIEFHKLPDRMQVQSIYASLEMASQGPKYQESKKIDRLSAIERACRVILSNKINPEAFCETKSSPNSKTVGDMFKNVDISDIFVVIKPAFEKKWKKAVAHTFLPDKLDEIVQKRHVVAHTADALNLERRDLKDACRFLKILALVLNNQLQSHVAKTIKSCK